ncbi:MAG: hypothetical protein ACYCO3_17000 [Mycobacteriales bacterium]
MSVTVHLRDEMAARLAVEAAGRGRRVDALAAELLADRLPAEPVARPDLQRWGHELPAHRQVRC